MPELVAGPPHPRHVVPWLISVALEDVRDKCARGQHTLPCTIRFRRAGPAVLAAALTHDDVLGCGMLNMDTGVGGTWQALEHFEEELRLELEKARGFCNRELDPVTGMPAVA